MMGELYSEKLIREMELLKERDGRRLVIVSRDIHGTLEELNLHARAAAAEFVKFAARIEQIQPEIFNG